MSKLNVNAFAFVPGQGFMPPSKQQPSQPSDTPSQPLDTPSQPLDTPSQPLDTPSQPLQHIERPERTEPLRSAPTISINIGNSKPHQAAAETPPEPVVVKPKPKETAAPATLPPSKATPISSTDASSTAPVIKSYNFTSEKSKTDTDAIVQEVHKTVDSETIGDLFGKQHLNVVFIGHVDAGKSTMGGNLLYVTGMVDKRTMEKYEKEAKEAGRESWYLSWALDSTPQERSKVYQPYHSFKQITDIISGKDC
jgi:peptide chain release factor subunit 3